MSVESQLLGSQWTSTSSGQRAGQRMTISNRTISKLSFKTFRSGTLNGNYWFRIRKVSDDSVLGEIDMGVCSAVTTNSAGVWYEGTFASPIAVNEEVRICQEVPSQTGGGNLGVWNSWDQTPTDQKSGEVYSFYSAGWSDTSSTDMVYSYTYIGATGAPSVTTQAVSAITATTATGNGNVTNLGVPAATQHGHCWATHTNPTIAAWDSKTENGVPAATGAYTSSLTGLIQNTLYYCRAYVTSSVGTFYGAEVSFTTSGEVPVVTTDLVTEIATTTALGNGSIDNNGGTAVTQHGVCWSTSANPTTADSKTEDGATDVIGGFFSLITGLTAATVYHARAYATNGTGTGYGADVTFTTMATGVPIVTTERTTNIQHTSATGNGTIVDIGSSAVTEHGHCWGTSVNPTTADSKTTKGAGTAGAFTSSITGLTAGTTYYTRAYATNSYGTSYGNNETIKLYGEDVGLIIIQDELLWYISKSGKRRYIEGTEGTET